MKEFLGGKWMATDEVKETVTDWPTSMTRGSSSVCNVWKNALIAMGTT
jgi:hypothetical protein